MKEIDMKNEFIVKDELQKETVVDSERIWTVYVHIVPKELAEEGHDMYYVGITSQKPKYRWKNGNGYKGQKFYNAICQYGWDNIKHEILAVHLLKEEACKLERTLIKELDCMVDHYGYNKDEGGIANVGVNKSPLEREQNFKTTSVFSFDVPDDEEAMRITIPQGETIICEKRHYNELLHYNLLADYKNGKLNRIRCLRPSFEHKYLSLQNVLFTLDFEEAIFKDKRDFRPQNIFFTTHSISCFYHHIINNKNNQKYLIDHYYDVHKSVSKELYERAQEEKKYKYTDVNEATRERDRLLFKIGQEEPAIAYALETFYTGQPCLYEGSPHFIERKE